MRIAVVTPVYPPYRAGMGNVAFHFARELQVLGNEVEVFTPKYSHMNKDNVDNNVHLLTPWASYGNAAFVPQLLWKLKNFDVVYAHLPFIGAAKGLLVYKLLHPSKKLVVHYQMDLIGEGFIKSIFWLYSQIFLRLLLAVADTIIVSSTDYANHSSIKSSLKNNKVVVVANGITYADFSKEQTPRVDANKPYIVFVGGLDKAHHFKGVPFLIDAWQEIHATIPEAHLYIIGNGGERSRFEKQAQESPAAGTIHFKINIDNEALVSYYKFAQATVLPSTTRGEAFGLVLLESMATGTPVVASGLPGVRTLVKEDKNGWIFEPGSQDKLVSSLIKALRADKEKMTEDCKYFAKTFDWKMLTEQLERILKK